MNKDREMLSGAEKKQYDVMQMMLKLAAKNSYEKARRMMPMCSQDASVVCIRSSFLKCESAAVYQEGMLTM